MESIQFQKPETVDEAVKLLQGADGDARILAGGTDLLVQLRAHMIDPSVIVDIKSIDETRELKKNADGSYTIGAAVAGAEAHEREDITADWPGVIEAWDLIGSTQIQGRASLGGNLCNASPAGDSVPRCWYDCEHRRSRWSSHASCRGGYSWTRENKFKKRASLSLASIYQLSRLTEVTHTYA